VWYICYTWWVNIDTLLTKIYIRQHEGSWLQAKHSVYGGRRMMSSRPASAMQGALGQSGLCSENLVSKRKKKSNVYSLW
jgi:ribosomal protein S19E (S16A)